LELHTEQLGWGPGVARPSASQGNKKRKEKRFCARDSRFMNCQIRCWKSGLPPPPTPRPPPPTPFPFQNFFFDNILHFWPIYSIVLCVPSSICSDLVSSVSVSGFHFIFILLAVLESFPWLIMVWSQSTGPSMGKQDQPTAYNPLRGPGHTMEALAGTEAVGTTTIFHYVHSPILKTN